MLRQLTYKFPIQPVIDQVSQLTFGKSIALNTTTGNLFSGPYTIKPEFKNTPLGDMLEALGNIGEARLLKLESGETYTAHTDPDDRYHVAVTTTDYAYIANLEDETLHHIPVDGVVWYMDTSFVHIATNFGATARIHVNIRALLPAFKSPGVHLKFSINETIVDWKQKLYINIMGYLNKAIKDNLVTGIAKINDKELLLNCDESVLEYIISTTTANGFIVEVIPV